MGQSRALLCREKALQIHHALSLHFQSQNYYPHFHTGTHCNCLDFLQNREYPYLSGKVAVHGFVKHPRNSELNMQIARIPRAFAAQQFTGLESFQNKHSSLKKKNKIK